MPLLEIKREELKPRLIQMGQAAREVGPALENLGESLQHFQQSIETATAEPHATETAIPIPDSPLEPVKQNRGRPKKMAKEKEPDHGAGGPETIRKDDAGEQGAIGTHGKNAPAQEKVPEKPEGKDNG